MTTNTIVRDSGLVRTRQGYQAEVIAHYTGRHVTGLDTPRVTLRARVYVDSYADQSSVKVEKWTDSGWVVVVYLRGEEFHAGAPSYAGGDDDKKAEFAYTLLNESISNALSVTGVES